MGAFTRLEPKHSTLIQAAIISVLLVLISFVYTTEEKASSDQKTIALAKR